MGYSSRVFDPPFLLQLSVFYDPHLFYHLLVNLDLLGELFLEVLHSFLQGLFILDKLFLAFHGFKLLVSKEIHHSRPRIT